MWAKGVSNRSSFINAAAETILHDLVQYNATLDATEANGRILTNPMSMISVEDDTARGTILPVRDSTGKQLLQELQEVALAGGVDFDLVKTGKYTWLFRVYSPQLGVDRSASVVFQTSADNIHTLSYDFVKTDTKTVGVTGGQGENESRLFVTRYGPDYSVFNHREVFISDSGSISDSLLAATTDKELELLRPRKRISFDARQVSNTQFGVHYNIGDIVSAKYRDTVSKYKVVGATIAWNPGQGEHVAVDIDEL
jgi:hypothetical protein